MQWKRTKSFEQCRLLSEFWRINWVHEIGINWDICSLDQLTTFKNRCFSQLGWMLKVAESDIWISDSWNKASPPPPWIYHVFKVCSNLYRRRLQGLIRPSKAGLVVSILVQCPAQSIIQATLLAYPYLHIYSSENSWKPAKV